MAAGNYRSFSIDSASSLRWQFGADNTAEAGSNAGSDFFVNAFDDSGTALGTVLKLTRSTLGASFGGPLAVTGAITSSAAISGTSLSTAGSVTANGGMTTTGDLRGGTVTATGDLSAGGTARVAAITVNAHALTLGGAFTLNGAYGVSLNATADTSVTLPASGTLATLAGSETLSNKTMGAFGVGVSSYSWLYTAIDLKDGGAVTSGTSGMMVACNLYRSSSAWLYKSDGYGGLYSIGLDGNHYWCSSVSGTAGAAASVPTLMELNRDGQLLLGYTSSNGSYPLQVNGPIFSTSSAIATSDSKYKTKVADLSGALSLIDALTPLSFTWKSGEEAGGVKNPNYGVKDANGISSTQEWIREPQSFAGGTQVGFFAQDVQTAWKGQPFLDAVVKSNSRPAIAASDGTVLAAEETFLGIAEGNLIPVLTAAVQELSATVTALLTRVAALEAKAA